MSNDDSSLSMVEGKLPPGFRFHPRDDELICDYLMNKLLLISPIPIATAFPLLVDVDLNKCEPWDLPEIACVGGKEWYFYSQRDRKYATGLRTNRATVSGYWKATGKDRAIVRKGTLVGMRKTLVFYKGRAPKGRKTDWVMHEFRLHGPFAPPNSSSQGEEDWVLCRVFHKSRESLPPKPNAVNASSLPPLMEDSFLSLDDNDNNNEIINRLSTNYQQQQVSCFSINNNNNPNHLFHAPPPSFLHNNLLFSGEAHIGTDDDNNINLNGGSSEVSARDRHVIKAVLSNLTNNMEASQPELRSMGDEAAAAGNHSESYLSDLMWTSMIE